MTNRNLLKEAIADAKAVKETAIANAKAALEEAFTPHLKSMLAAKLEEMDKDEDVEEAMKSKKEEDMMEESKVNEKKDEIDEEFDLNEILAELEEGEDKEEMDEAEDMDAVEDEMETDEMEDVEIDLEDMTEDDLKSFIEDVIADMVAAGELEAGEEMEAEMDDIEAEEEMSDMEELDEMDEVSWNEKNNPTRGATLDKLAPTKVGQTTPAYAINEKVSESNVSEAMDPQTIEMIAAALGPLLVGGSAFAIDKAMKALKAGKAGKVGQALANQLEKAGSEASKAAKSGQSTGTFEGVEFELNKIEELKKELQEVNLLNAKLLYTNKIFNSKNLNESQKLRVLKAFDKASSVKEAKVIFETLNEGMVSKTVKSSMINEIKSSASKATGFIRENKQPIVEVDPMVTRWQKLAGIK
jgi:hypothetical protein